MIRHLNILLRYRTRFNDDINIVYQLIDESSSIDFSNELRVWSSNQFLKYIFFLLHQLKLNSNGYCRIDLHNLFYPS